MSHISNTTFTNDELLFVARATMEKDGSSVGEMVDDYGYTHLQCGGFLTSLQKKTQVTIWQEPEAAAGYRNQFGFEEDMIELAFNSVDEADI